MKRQCKNPFLTPARKLCDRLKLADRRGDLEAELEILGVGRKNTARDFYVKKLADLMAVAVICAAVMIALLIYGRLEDRHVADATIARPGYGEAASDESLNLVISGEEETEAVEVHIEARQYTDDEVEGLFQTAQAEMKKTIIGENESLDDVKRPLELSDSFADGRVKAEYEFHPSNLVDDDGTILWDTVEEYRRAQESEAQADARTASSAGSQTASSVDSPVTPSADPDAASKQDSQTKADSGTSGADGVILNIFVTLTCQGKEQVFKCAARLTEPDKTSAQELSDQISQAVSRAADADPTAASVKLPGEVQGRKLTWYRPKSTGSRVIFLAVLLLPVFVWTHADQEVHDRAKERKAQLELDYSELLWKLTMLLGAGLTISGAWKRIVSQYLSQKEQTGVRYVYEEMQLTLREMRSGVPEETAYENFGRRCSLPEYIKLGSVLAQNLKKGSKGLTALLEKEAQMSMEMHKMAAKKAGEKASVKMLLPMLMMFGVVLIILMVPAFLAM